MGVDDKMVSETTRRVWTQTRKGRTESVWKLPDGSLRMIATTGDPEMAEAAERDIIGKMLQGKICLLCLQPTEADHVDTCTRCAQMEMMVEDLLKHEGWRIRLQEMLDTADEIMGS